MKGDEATLGGESLEARTATAHREYLDALLAWEEARRRRACGCCDNPSAAEEACEAARAEEERCRTVFRDLYHQLGYVPAGYGLELPPERPVCKCMR